ncbi:SusD family protein [compost metagenome]
MHLIIAEAAARSNNLPTALNQLDIVRKTRFLPADYVQFASTDQETVLQKVLAERTFEFPYNGLRWFDMRRLDAEGRMTKVERYDAGGNVISTLLPGSNKYTLQIPLSVMYFNQSWQQNPID